MAIDSDPDVRDGLQSHWMSSKCQGRHRRTGQHPFGGADRVLPEWIQWGGGGSSRNFPGSIFSGGGVVAEIFRDPYYVGGRIFSVSGSGRP